MPLTVVGACAVPLIYFFNSYFIGKFLKRFFPQHNAYLLTSLGFFVFLGFVFLFSLLVFVIPSRISEYAIVLLIMQLFLIVLYGLNWRYSFSLEKTNQLTAWFCLAVFLVVAATWFLSNNIEYNPTLNTNLPFGSYQQGLTNYFSKLLTWDTQVFDPTNDPKQILYTSWNALNLLWIFLFEVNQQTLFDPYAAYFSSYSLLVVFAAISALGFTGVFHDHAQRRDGFKLGMVLVAAAAINLLLFLFITNPLNGLCWVVPMALIVLKLNYEETFRATNYQSDFVFAALLVIMYSLSQIFAILAIALIVLKFVAGLLIKREHLLTSMMVSGIGLVLTLVFVLQGISAAGAIALVVSGVLFYGAWFVAIRKTGFKAIARRFELFLQRNVFVILTLTLTIIYGVSIVLTFAGGQTNFDISSWILFNNPFAPQINPQSPARNALEIVLNGACWAFNLVAFGFCANQIIVSKLVAYFRNKAAVARTQGSFAQRAAGMRRQVYGTVAPDEAAPRKTLRLSRNQEQLLGLVDFESEYFVLISFLLFLIVWNPISTNIAKKINFEFNLDVSWLFFLVAIGLLFNDLGLKSKRQKAAFLSCGCVGLAFLVSLVAAYNFIP